MLILPPVATCGGYANIDGDIPELATCKDTLASTLMGTGHIMITVDQSTEGGRYQGVVALDKDTLEACIKEYFEKSAQFASFNRIACAKTQQVGVQGVRGISKLPAEETKRDVKAEQENWEEKIVLLNSLKDDELVDVQLSAEDIIYRLYHTSEIKVFETSALQDTCRCNSQRMHTALNHLDKAEKKSMFEKQNNVEIICQYCSKQYLFSPKDLGVE